MKHSLSHLSGGRGSGLAQQGSGVRPLASSSDRRPSGVVGEFHWTPFVGRGRRQIQPACAWGALLALQQKTLSILQVMYTRHHLLGPASRHSVHKTAGIGAYPCRAVASCRIVSFSAGSELPIAPMPLQFQSRPRAAELAHLQNPMGRGAPRHWALAQIRLWGETVSQGNPLSFTPAQAAPRDSAKAGTPLRLNFLAVGRRLRSPMHALAISLPHGKNLETVRLL